MAAYYTALDQTSGQTRGTNRGEPPRRSLRTACIGYFASSAFNNLDARTKRVRRSILDEICRERGASSGQEYGLSHLRTCNRSKDLSILRITFQGTQILK